MREDASGKPSAYRKLMDIIMAGECREGQRTEYPDFYDYIELPDCPGISVELQPSHLTEATRAQIGRFTARRDPPHFAGDEYHGHCDVGGGREVSWSISGARRHPTKFPAQIPRDAKAAVANVLGVSPDILEAFWVEGSGKKILLLEFRTA